MNFINAIKRALRTPTAAELAVQELAEAKRQLLSALTAKDYATAMVQYHSDRIARLEGGSK